jgi:hypothetical protein
MGRANRTGRSSGGGRFTAVHEFMQSSAAWQALKPQDRAVYLEVARVYNGSNNGYLIRSVRQLAELANINKDTAGKCLGRLVDLGFVECATPGGFSRKTPHAAEWRLTQYKCDRTGAMGTKAFLRWRPEMQNAVRNEGQAVRNEGTVVALGGVHCPKARDGSAPIEGLAGPLVSDTYTSSHRQGVRYA